MARRSIVRYGPSGGAYHEHVTTGGNSGGSGPAIAILFLGAVITFAILKMALWDTPHQDAQIQQAAQVEATHLSLASSNPTFRYGRRDSVGARLLKVQAPFVAKNTDASAHTVTVCVATFGAPGGDFGGVCGKPVSVPAHSSVRGKVAVTWTIDSDDSPKVSPAYLQATGHRSQTCEMDTYDKPDGTTAATGKVKCSGF
jgi:hypothetical protein